MSNIGYKVRNVLQLGLVPLLGLSFWWFMVSFCLFLLIFDDWTNVPTVNPLISNHLFFKFLSLAPT